MIIGVSALLILGFSTYIYYVMMDREDSPVSKEELGYAVLSNTIMGVGVGAVIFIMMILRISTLYPPVDGVDMGEPPFWIGWKMT